MRSDHSLKYESPLEKEIFQRLLIVTSKQHPHQKANELNGKGVWLKI